MHQLGARSECPVTLEFLRVNSTRGTATCRKSTNCLLPSSARLKRASPIEPWPRLASFVDIELKEYTLHKEVFFTYVTILTLWQCLHNYNCVVLLVTPSLLLMQLIRGLSNQGQLLRTQNKGHHHHAYQCTSQRRDQEKRWYWRWKWMRASQFDNFSTKNISNCFHSHFGFDASSNVNSFVML